MTLIHRTLTDSDGNTYKVVSSRWLRVLTAIAAGNFVILILIVAVLIENARTINEEVQYTNKAGQRNAALNEIAEGRAIALRWTYEQVCEKAQEAGKKCVEGVQWYADPSKYPLIANDPAGSGIFPPK